MIHFKIKEEIYDIPLVVIVGSWQDKCDYLQNKYNIEQGNKQFFGGESVFFTDDGFSITAIWLPSFKYSEPYDIATLVHEIDHSVFRILEHVNIPILDNHSNHTYIYLKEYFLAKALKKLKGV